MSFLNFHTVIIQLFKTSPIKQWDSRCIMKLSCDVMQKLTPFYIVFYYNIRYICANLQ